MRDNLAGTLSPSKPLDALEDLANVQDDAVSFERFASHWPDFAYVVDDKPSDLDNCSGEEFFRKYGFYRTTFGGYDFGEPMTRMPPSIPKRFFLMWQMREALREIWRGSSKRLRDVLIDVMVQSLDELIGDKDSEAGSPPQLKLDWHRGEFVYTPQSKFQGAVYQLFRRSALAKFCANPDCPAPYFIAGRTTQQYCSEKCSGVLQRTQKLRWWKEHGSEWRRASARKRSRRK
jgi:hypothetical protein